MSVIMWTISAGLVIFGVGLTSAIGSRRRKNTPQRREMGMASECIHSVRYGGSTVCHHCAEDEAKDRRIKELEQQLADERLAFDHANEVIGKLEADIAALSWTQIAPENLPKVGDEVKYVKIAGKFNVGKMRVEIVEADWKEGWLQRSDAIVWAEYRRPLNPPPRALEPQ